MSPDEPVGGDEAGEDPDEPAGTEPEAVKEEAEEFADSLGEPGDPGEPPDLDEVLDEDEPDEPWPEEDDDDPWEPAPGGPPDEAPEDEEEPDDLGPGEAGDGEPPEPAPGGPPDEPPEDEGEPALPGAGHVVLADVLDGLGSRRVAWTLLGTTTVLAAAAYWRGLSDARWLLLAGFLLVPALMLPAFVLRFPLERRSGHDRVLATYPSGRGRYLAGRYVAFLLLGAVYLAVAVAVTGAVLLHAGPYWLERIPRFLGLGALVVAVTASLGVFLGTAFGRAGGRTAAGLGLAVGALAFAGTRIVYLLEDLPELPVVDGSAAATLVVRGLHLLPTVPAASLALPPEVFPVHGAPIVEAAVLPALALGFLLLGILAYVVLQGPGGWAVHPAVVAAFALMSAVALATPLAIPVQLDRGDPVVERTRDEALDVTADVELDLRGVSSEPTVEGELTRGKAYDGFLSLAVEREDTEATLNLTNVTADVESELLGVDDGDELGRVAVPPASEGARTVPVDVPVSVASVPGALDPIPATAVVEVASDQASFTVVADDLETATLGADVVRWVPAGAVVLLAVLEGAVLVVARRPL